MSRPVARAARAAGTAAAVAALAAWGLPRLPGAVTASALGLLVVALPIE